MPRLIAIQGQPEDRAIQEAVESLRAGKSIGLPSATGYITASLAGAATSTEAFGLPMRMAFGAHESALEMIPTKTKSLVRLLNRCWPGPLVVAAQDREITVPSHPFLQAVLDTIEPDSLVLSSDQGGARFKTAAALSEAEPTLDAVFDAGALMYDQSASVVRATADGFEIVFSGILSDQAIRVSACEIYTFVCTGNTCRSPLAEGMFRKLLAESLQCSLDEVVDRGYLVESAGLAAAMGSPASPESVELLRNRGVDLSQHASQPLTTQIVEASDHIFTMTNGHRDAILGYRPDLAETVQVLRRDGGDVVDPIGGGMGEYQRCEQEIEESLRAIIDSHIKKGSDE